MSRPIATARVADRRADLATIHCLQKDLRLDKADADALKLAITGMASSADMSGEQRAKYIGHLRRLKKALEDKPAYTAVRAPLQRSTGDGLDDRWSKARALWALLAQAGEVRVNTDAALMVYVKRQTQLEHWRFLNTLQINTVIESLKRWCRRAKVGIDNG